jgi:hypothetical protein
MAKIRNAKKGREDGGYSRVFGHPQLGALMSRVQATTISAGTELEKLISEKHGQLMDASQLGLFLGNRLPAGTYVVGKSLIKKHLKSVIQSTSEPDFVVVIIVDSKIYVVELKDCKKESPMLARHTRWKSDSAASIKVAKTQS